MTQLIMEGSGIIWFGLITIIHTCITIYVKSFEGENFRSFHRFLLTANVLPLKIFLEYWHCPLTTQSMVPSGLINNKQSVEMLCGTWPTMLPLF